MPPGILLYGHCDHPASPLSQQLSRIPSPPRLFQVSAVGYMANIYLYAAFALMFYGLGATATFEIIWFHFYPMADPPQSKYVKIRTTTVPSRIFDGRLDGLVACALDHGAEKIQKRLLCGPVHERQLRRLWTDKFF